MNGRNAGVLIAAGAVFLAVVLTVCTVANASRNSSGTMSPANGPYISGTTITSTSINSRFADVENEITDSLSRSGKGGMTAPLKESDGTVAAPSFSFTSEPGSGLYRIGANDFGFSVNGAKKHEWTSTGESVTGTLGVSGAATLSSTLALGDVLTQTIAGSANSSGYSMLEASLSNGNSTQIVIGKANSANNAATFGFMPNATAALSTGCLGMSFVNGSILCVDGNAKTTAAGALAVTGATTLTGAAALNGGATFGSSGTAITASYQGSHSFTGTTISASSCNNTTTVTVTGTTAGDPCSPGTDSGFLATGIFLACATTTDGCIVQVCNASTSGQVVAGTTLKCRTWH